MTALLSYVSLLTVCLGHRYGQIVKEIVFGQMPRKASDPRRGHVRYHRLQNSLNINFTGIHAFEYSFSVKLYKK